MTIKFTITGNPFDPKGNPIPYTRTTQGTKHTPRYQRYVQWVSYVQNQFCNNNPDATGMGKYTLNLFRHKKPILLAPSIIARVDLKISWANKKGGDGDNVLKGILDALFVQDKWVSGSYDWAVNPDAAGAVEVAITFMHAETKEPIALNELTTMSVACVSHSNDLVRQMAARKFNIKPKNNAEQTTEA